MNTENAEREIVPLEPRTLQVALTEEAERRELLKGYIRDNLRAGVDFGTIKMGGRESKPFLFKPGAEKICSLLHYTATFSVDEPTLKIVGEGIIPYLCRLLNRSGEVIGEGRGSCSIAEKQNNANVAIKIAQKRAHIDAVLRVAALSDMYGQDEDIVEDYEKKKNPVTPTIPKKVIEAEHSPQVQAAIDILEPTSVEVRKISARTHCMSGKNKGVAWKDMNKKQLSWYRDFYQSKLDDPSQEQYAKDNIDALDGIDFEFDVRMDKES